MNFSWRNRASINFVHIYDILGYSARPGYIFKRNSLTVIIVKPMIWVMREIIGFPLEVFAHKKIKTLTTRVIEAVLLDEEGLNSQLFIQKPISYFSRHWADWKSMRFRFFPKGVYQLDGEATAPTQNNQIKVTDTVWFRQLWDELSVFPSTVKEGWAAHNFLVLTVL